MMASVRRDSKIASGTASRSPRTSLGEVARTIRQVIRLQDLG